VEFALRTEWNERRMRRCARLVAAFAFAGAVTAAPREASAEGLFDFLFSGLQKQQHQAPRLASFFADPSSQQAAPVPARTGGSGPAFCVRSCDGRYFPLSRGNASPVQMCQAFCPASPTKVFFGSHIESASSASGERYADSENAFAYRKALRADCTCNGRNSVGLAPVDPPLDTSLRAGDLIATTDGLVAYSGIRVGNSQTAEFTPVASYRGLTAQVRARLGELKVAPVNSETIADETLSLPVNPLPATPKSALAKDRRAEAD
jgi:hypothetical protein